MNATGNEKKLRGLVPRSFVSTLSGRFLQWHRRGRRLRWQGFDLAGSAVKNSANRLPSSAFSLADFLALGKDRLAVGSFLFFENLSEG
jgi:hypothetical protein